MTRICTSLPMFCPTKNIVLRSSLPSFVPIVGASLLSQFDSLGYELLDLMCLGKLGNLTRNACKPFFANFGAIVTISIFGTFIASIVTGILVYLGGLSLIMYKLPFVECLMFGALISATDPVTVLSIFQDFGTDVNLYALVFGESVLNDAMAISLYRTMSSVQSKGSGQNFLLLVFWFIENFFGSLASVFKTWSVVCLFFFHISRKKLLEFDTLINCIICSILVMKHYTFSNLSYNSQRFVAAFFHLISSLAETFVFIYMGFDIAMEKHSWSHIFIVISCSYHLTLHCVAHRFINMNLLSVLLIGGSTSTMLEALHVVGDANDGPLGESFEGNHGYIAPYDEGASSGSRLKMRLKEFQNSAATFTALDRNYLTPFFTTQNGDDEDGDDFDERPPPNPRGGRGFRAVRS
ncbi:hypothetical protein ACHQM5_026862 [Ranunculus cassubicifolius]